MHDYESRDEPIENPQLRYKVKFYFAILDTVLVSLEERFGQLEEISQIFGFLYDIARLATEPCLNVLEHCKKLASALEYNGHSDICAFGLADELKAFAGKITAGSPPKTVLEFIFLHKLED